MIGVIADDLTGAAEIGAVGVRHGLSAEVVLEAPITAQTELVCVDTDSRSCPPEEAGRRAAAAAEALAGQSVKWIYKKVDSVLRGNVVAEIEAMMEELGAARALLVPANPGLGRIIRNGEYLVRGKPIHETDFRFDPEYPRRSSSVKEMLGGTGKNPVRVRRLGESVPSKGIVVGEAQSARDLRRWASRRADFGLVAGGAEFFDAVLGRELSVRVEVKNEEREGKEEERDRGSEVFVCGSISESTRDFVAASRERGVPVFSLPEELAQGVEFGSEMRERLARQIGHTLESNPRVVLEIGWPRVSDPRLARELPDLLSHLAADVLSRAQIGQVYAEGGATAAGLVRHMGWKRLKVVRELAPGVVTLQTEELRARRLTMKPGSYTWPRELQFTTKFSKQKGRKR